MKIDANMVEKAGHRGVHNFTYGILETYFKLSNLSDDNIWFNGNVLVLSGLPGRAGHKSWVYDIADIGLLRGLQTKGPVYSINKIGLPKESKFKELTYDLTTVFAASSYANAKKRAKVLTYPRNWMKNNEISVETNTKLDLAEVVLLHDEWKKYKLSLPATFKMMFPSKRYYNCVEIGLRDPDRYTIFSAYNSEHGLVAVRVLYVDKAFAFDLANFCCSWRLPSNFSEYFNSYTMRLLYDKGVKLLNCGASLNKELSAFKKHWPHSELISYAYGRTE